MRWLALARYRYLTSVRRATAVFVTIAIVIVLVAIVTMNLAMPDVIVRRWAPIDTIQRSAAAIFGVYAFQTAALMAASLLAFGTVRRHANDAAAADLLDTAPVSSSTRFWGDAAGVFAASMAVHLAMLPILAVAFAVTPWNSWVLVALEALTASGCALAACAASWTLRAHTYRWSLTRALRTVALFVILLLSIFLMTTEWIEFRDALVRFFDHAEIAALKEVADACTYPAGTAFLLFALYAGFIAFYYARSTRNTETI